MAAIEVQVVNVPSVAVAVVRREATAAALSSVVPEGCGIVWSFIQQRKLRAGRNVAIYWDGRIRLEVGVELFDPIDETGDGADVVESATPEGRAASAVVYGPYDQLRRAHEAIHAWCTAHGEQRAGPSWEVYGHWQMEWDTDPSRIRTDVFHLLVPAGRRHS